LREDILIEKLAGRR